MSDIKPKKMVSRSVAIALGVICIVLASGLIVAVKDVYDNYDTVNLNNSTILVSKRTVQFEAPNGSVEWGSPTGENNSFKIDYAGYIIVTFYPHDNGFGYPFGYYVRLNYTYQTYWFERTFDYQTYDESAIGYAYFFTVLPTNNLQILVGNSELNGTIIADVIITYYY